MRLGAVGVDEGDALGDQPASARGLRRRDKIGRALDAQPGIAAQRLAAALRIEHLRQIGQLMDDDFGVGLHDGIMHCGTVENIDDDGLRALLSQRLGLFGRPRRAGHLMSSGDQERRQSPSDDAGRAGKKDSHLRPPSARPRASGDPESLPACAFGFPLARE